ncbi:MAG: hypothetical protein IMZ50_01830 [Candidatus Atribacteria bacterium]|nr:hypothetical protein [Spirochaetota bacterium]MBE3117481.1 hypothetical protein [Candidatus Atribacteria bacterium]
MIRVNDQMVKIEQPWAYLAVAASGTTWWKQCFTKEERDCAMRAETLTRYCVPFDLQAILDEQIALAAQNRQERAEMKAALEGAPKGVCPDCGGRRWEVAECCTCEGSGEVEADVNEGDGVAVDQQGFRIRPDTGTKMDDLTAQEAREAEARGQ